MERYETARIELDLFDEDVITASDTSGIVNCEKITHSDERPTTWWVFYKDYAERYDQNEEPEVWSQCP